MNVIPEINAVKKKKKYLFIKSNLEDKHKLGIVNKEPRSLGTV